MTNTVLYTVSCGMHTFLVSKLMKVNKKVFFHIVLFAPHPLHCQIQEVEDEDEMLDHHQHLYTLNAKPKSDFLQLG